MAWPCPVSSKRCSAWIMVGWPSSGWSCGGPLDGRANPIEDGMKPSHPIHAQGLLQTQSSQQVGRHAQHFLRPGTAEGLGQDGDETFDGRRLLRHVGMDHYPAVVHLDPQVDGRHALVDAV